MTIVSQNFATLVANQVAAIQGAATKLVDLTIGSILRAVVEANAAVALWLQGLVLTLLAKTRAATSNGADLDSWVGDFGLTRLPAVATTGAVTFARFTPTNAATIPIGSVVQSGDGSQKYTVTIDATNPAYSAGAGGYVIAAGVSSVTVPVQNTVAGAAGNAAAGVVSVLTQAIPGVDTVTNALQFTSGSNAETDAALRLRFQAYINSLSEATPLAITNAVKAIGTNITALVVENLTYAGAVQYGYFYVVVDDGSGSPPPATLTAALNAINATRPIGSQFGVYAPVIVTANLALTCSVATGYDPVGTKALVQAALLAYADTLPLGATLPWARIAQVAFDASPGITNVTAVTINGGTADLVPTTVQVVKAGTVTVS